MLRSDGLLLALLVVRKHPDSRAGVRETVRAMEPAESASAHAVGQALIRKKLLSPQEFLVLQTLVEGAHRDCRCGRRLELLPGRTARRRRCPCGTIHTIAAFPGLLTPGSKSGSRRTRRRGPSERTAPPAPDESSSRSKRIGRYALLARVGDGGMGTIWKALEPGTGRPVALKLLRPDASEDTKVRFQREAEALARLDHPAVVRVHDVAADERGRRFFTMEFVEGRELRELLPTIQPRTLIELIARVAEGLHHAHEQGIVHRDTKPHNIIVTPDGQPKIADFGLSRDLERTSLTEAGDLVGTPLYMSPEQLRGDPGAIDRRTDVYALGVLLYEGLTGRLPIEAKSLFDLQQKIPRAIPERPSRVRPGLPRELDRVVLRALEKRPEDRYGTALELARDLREYLAAQEPPRTGDGPASPPAEARPARAPFRRALGTTLLVLAALGGGAALVVHRVREAEHARAAAEALEKRQEAARTLLAGLERSLSEARSAQSRQDATAAAAAARAGLAAADQLRRQVEELGLDAPAAVASGIPVVRAALTRVAADALAKLGPDEREQARRLYRALLQASPAEPDPAVFGALGRLELEDEHIPGALRHLNAALARDRERADDYWRRGEAYRHLGRPDYALLDYQAGLERVTRLQEVRPAWLHAGRARALLAQGKLESAAEAVNEALRQDSLDVEARLAQTVLLVASGSPEEALSRLASLVTALPHDGRVRRAAAAAWLAAGDPERGMAELDAAVAADPTPSGFLMRARLHGILGEDGPATTDLEGAIDRALPEDPVRQLARLVQARHLRAQGRLQDALAALSEALPATLARDQKLPQELLPHLLERVEVRLQQGQDLPAIEPELELLLSQAPGERRVLLARAELRLRRGEAARAQAELERLPARELEPRALTLLARAQLAQRGNAGAEGALAAALRAQEGLLQLDPPLVLGPADPLVEALLLLERGRRVLELAGPLPAGRAAVLEPARADLERAARLAPWLVPARVALCRALLLADAVPDALREAERGLQESLPAPELLAARAEALGMAGQAIEALAAWDEALRLSGSAALPVPRDLPRFERRRRARWLVLRARAARQAGKPAEARRDLDEALTVWPDYLEALDERQALAWAAGEKAAAEADRARLDLLRRGAKGVLEAALRDAWRAGSAGDTAGAIAALAPAFALIAPEHAPEAAAELFYARAFLRRRGQELPEAVADLAAMLEWSKDGFLAVYDEAGPLATTPGVDLAGVLDQLGPRSTPEGCDPDFLGAFVAFLARELGAGGEARLGPGVRACERFLARHPAHFAARLLRAALLAHSGRSARAMYLIRQALHEPACPAYAHFLAARLLAADHDLPRALQALEEALAGGFVPWERIESDPWLAPVHEARGYARVVALSKGAGLLSRGKRLEEQARAHREGRADALAEATEAASAGLSALQPLLGQDDPRAADLAGRLYLLRARQAFRLGKEADLARDLVAAIEAAPALLLEWDQLEEGARAASRLPSAALAGASAREGELHPRAFAPVAAPLFQALLGASVPPDELARARERLGAAPLAGTALGAVCEAVLLCGSDPPAALNAARAVAERTPSLGPLSAWLEARVLAGRGDAAALIEPLRQALAGGLRGPIERDPALQDVLAAPELQPLLQAAAEAGAPATWELE